MNSIIFVLLQLGNLLDEAEYQKRIVPCVVKLFASTDRITRARLLQTLVHFIGHLQPQVVNDQIFPNVAIGFLDTNPYIRDQTIEVYLRLNNCKANSSKYILLSTVNHPFGA